MKGYTKFPIGVGGGVNKDLPPQDLDQQTFSDIHNLHMKDHRLEPVQGYASVFDDASVTPKNLLGVIRSDVPTIYAAGDLKLWQNANAIWLDVSRTVGGAYTGDDWQNTVLNNCLFFNNGQDKLQVMEAADSVFKDSANIPANFYAKVFRGFNNYLFALNLSEGGTLLPTALRWSDPADPGVEPPSWDVTDPTTQAGQVVLADTDGALLDAMQLRDQLIIYKTDSVYTCQFIGGIFVFSFQKIISDRGMLSRNCVAAFENNHFVVGFDDIYIHDGLQARSISEGRVKNFFYNDLDQDYLDNVFVVPNYRDKEVLVCYPNDESLDGSCNKALVWNWEHNIWTTRDIPNLLHATSAIIDPKVDDIWDVGVDDTWDLGGLHWDANNYSPANLSLVGASSYDGDIYQFNDTATFDGSTFDFYLEKLSYSYGIDENVKHLNHLTPNISGQGVLSQRFGTQNHLGEGVRWKPIGSYELGKFRSYTKASGRYFSYRFFGNTEDVLPSIGGLDSYLSIEGEK